MIFAGYFIKEGLFNYTGNISVLRPWQLVGWAYLLFNRQSPFSNTFLYKKPIQILIYTILAFYLIFHSNIDNVIWNSIFKSPVISKFIIDFMFLYLIVGV